MATERTPSPEAPRIDAAEAHRHVEDGDAKLVCAYDSDEKFEQNRLDQAMPLAEFEADEDSTPMDQEIIFYCA